MEDISAPVVATLVVLFALFTLVALVILIAAATNGCRFISDSEPTDYSQELSRSSSSK